MFTKETVTCDISRVIGGTHLQSNVWLLWGIEFQFVAFAEYLYLTIGVKFLLLILLIWDVARTPYNYYI